LDPWVDYDGYSEYQGEQSSIYDSFIKNLDHFREKEKIIVKRGFSNVEIPKFEDNFFDIIYIDGNHEPQYTLEDAVLSFRKLKKEGILIFDGYGWGGSDMTQRGIDAFLSGYHKKILFQGHQNTQVFIKKVDD
jgi:hypothetical protein